MSAQRLLFALFLICFLGSGQSWLVLLNDQLPLNSFKTSWQMIKNQPKGADDFKLSDKIWKIKKNKQKNFKLEKTWNWNWNSYILNIYCLKFHTYIYQQTIYSTVFVPEYLRFVLLCLANITLNDKNIDLRMNFCYFIACASMMKSYMHQFHFLFCIICIA